MIPASELSDAIVGVLILAVGLVALAFAAMRLPSRDRVPFWFGLFACLYGVRLAGGSELVRAFIPLSPIAWTHGGAFITYAILVPAALFVESLFGPGWRGLLRRLWQGLAVYATLAIANDLVRGEPRASMWLNAPAAITFATIGTAHLIAYWRWTEWSRGFRVAVIGGLLFGAGAAYETLGGTVPVEAVAMLVFVASLGYLVAERMLDGERRLVAVSRELELARQIQQSILPRTVPRVAGLRLAACCLPMSDVAGDFYDLVPWRPGSLALVVADVSGHGVPAALVASMVKVAFAAEADRLDAPGIALTNMNRTLCGRFEGAYVTACCALVDTAGGRVRYARAGHPPPLLRRADGRIERLDAGGLALVFDPAAEYTTTDVALGSGDRLVFFSDGLLEATNPRDEFFGDRRLEQLLADPAPLAPGPFLDRLVQELRAWIGRPAELQDDVTVVVVDLGEVAGVEERRRPARPGTRRPREAGRRAGLAARSGRADRTAVSAGSRALRSGRSS
jgi:phosphoserine phosphatase RsbU/P